MACYHPLKAWQIGFNESGKPKYKITSYDTKYLVRNKNGDWISAKESISSDMFNPKIKEFIEIPCGKCIGCRLHYSAQWAQRCMLEAGRHEKNCFITLTYDNKHIPECNPICDDNGLVIASSPYHPLKKSDFQEFMKRFRQRLVDDYKREHKDWKKEELPRIRFFACGEYGSEENTKRPHYHAIIFGYNFDSDRYIFRKNFRGDTLYRSDLLESLWTYGISTVAECSFDTCAYVARYILKKQYGKGASIYEDLNIPPEFTVMSRRPGIARDYYEENKDKIYEYQEIFIADKNKGSLKLRPSKYYDRLYDVDYPERMKEIKEERQERAKQINRKRDEMSSLDHLSLLEVQEDVLLNRTKILKERSVKLR